MQRVKRSRTHRLLVECAATDNTFSLAHVRGRAALIGKCIHCNCKVVVELDPGLRSSATIEHIRPRVHGGDDSPENLALACGRCNAMKGVRLDSRRFEDETLQRVIHRLSEKRRERMRERIDVTAYRHSA